MRPTLPENTARLFRLGLLLLPISALIAGCTSMWQSLSGGERRGVSSSLVEYLYPAGEEPPPTVDSIPQLQIPLRVGLAFVPSAVESDTPVLSEATKTELLERVREQFLDREYIDEIEVIPDTYMRTGHGFTSLQQISRIYHLDVMALVSYDQVVAYDDTKASFLYWTIIGAYVVKGSKNDVQTFVDTAVFDIPTRQLLFRAPGIDKSSSKATLVESAGELRETRTVGFRNAMDDMNENLAIELHEFEFRIKEDPTVAQVVSESGGGGAVSLWACLFLFTALMCVRFSKEYPVGRGHRGTR
jgi:rhombotail lipoprotein